MLTTNKNKEIKSHIFDIELCIYSPSFISPEAFWVSMFLTTGKEM